MRDIAYCFSEKKYCHLAHYCALILWAMKAVIVGLKLKID